MRGGEEEFSVHGVGNQYNGYPSECLDSDSILDLVSGYRWLWERGPSCLVRKLRPEEQVTARPVLQLVTCGVE